MGVDWPSASPEFLFSGTACKRPPGPDGEPPIQGPDSPFGPTAIAERQPCVQCQGAGKSRARPRTYDPNIWIGNGQHEPAPVARGRNPRRRLPQILSNDRSNLVHAEHSSRLMQFGFTAAHTPTEGLPPIACPGPRKAVPAYPIAWHAPGAFTLAAVSVRTQRTTIRVWLAGNQRHPVPPDSSSSRQTENSAPAGPRHRTHRVRRHRNPTNVKRGKWGGGAKRRLTAARTWYVAVGYGRIGRIDVLRRRQQPGLQA